MTKIKRAVFLMGRPGSGKDTQAKFLADRFNLYQIVTSDLLQEKFKALPDDPIIKSEKEKFETGILNTPAWVLEVVKEKVSGLVQKNFEGCGGLIFSGSPRTIYEAENLVPFLEEIFGLENMLALYLDITAEEGIKRILLRSARSLDKDPERLRIRMKEYEEQTTQVLEYLEKKNILIKVDGMPSREAIFEDILSKMKDFPR